MAGDRALQRTQQSKIPPEARRLIDFLNSQRRGEKPDGRTHFTTRLAARRSAGTPTPSAATARTWRRIADVATAPESQFQSVSVYITKPITYIELLADLLERTAAWTIGIASTRYPPSSCSAACSGRWSAGRRLSRGRRRHSTLVASTSRSPPSGAPDRTSIFDVDPERLAIQTAAGQIWCHPPFLDRCQDVAWALSPNRPDFG